MQRKPLNSVRTDSICPGLLTDIDEILVGHYTSPHRPTGCTVVTALNPFVAGVDVRGILGGLPGGERLSTGC
jgi:L-aminopeptidase/D-esterase-like protein